MNRKRRVLKKNPIGLPPQVGVLQKPKGWNRIGKA